MSDREALLFFFPLVLLKLDTHVLILIGLLLCSGLISQDCHVGGKTNVVVICIVHGSSKGDKMVCGLWLSQCFSSRMRFSLSLCVCALLNPKPPFAQIHQDAAPRPLPQPPTKAVFSCITPTRGAFDPPTRPFSLLYLYLLLHLLLHISRCCCRCCSCRRRRRRPISLLSKPSSPHM